MRPTPAGGSFMGIISCLMQLRKVVLGCRVEVFLGVVLLMHPSGGSS